MPRLNYPVMLSNVREAREQLEALERALSSEAAPSESSLHVAFAHAFHHVNVAWNARRCGDARYRRMSDADFNTWGRYPRDLELVRLPVPRRRRVKAR